MSLWICEILRQYSSQWWRQWSLENNKLKVKANYYWNALFQKLILSETAIFEFLPSFFYHSNEAVRRAALEVSFKYMLLPFLQYKPTESCLIIYICVDSNSITFSQVYIRRSYQAYELTTLYHEMVIIFFDVFVLKITQLSKNPSSRLDFHNSPSCWRLLRFVQQMVASLHCHLLCHRCLFLYFFFSSIWIFSENRCVRFISFVHCAFCHLRCWGLPVL